MQLPSDPGEGAAPDSIWRLPPPPDLAPWVEAIAGRRAEKAAWFPVFPTARAELIFHFGDPFLVGERSATMRPLPPAALLGPRREIYWQSAGPRIDWFLVQLTPLGCRRLLGLRFAEAWNREAPPAGLLTGRASMLHDRLRATPSFAARAAIAVETLRAFSLPLERDPLSELVSLARAGRVRTLATMARRLGVGPRRLHQLFTAEIGISPKLFLSLMRFGRQLESRHPFPAIGRRDPDDPEYADDSHAIREFRRFAGLTPGAYVTQKRSGDRLVYTGEPVLPEP